ncbi:MAG: tyrosine-type recombinase/integrase, partial [bacterium]
MGLRPSGVAYQRDMSNSKSPSDKNTRKERPKLRRLQVDVGESKQKESQLKAELTSIAREYIEYQQGQGLKYKSTLGMYYALADFVAFAGQEKVITPKLLKAWVEDLVRRKKAGWTVVEWAKICKRWFRWMLEKEYIEANPWLLTDIKIKPSPFKTDRFSESEYKMMKAKAKGTVWYYAIVIGYNTGLRMVDVANLKLEDINFEDQVIDMMPRKTKRLGTRVTIPFRSDTDISRLLYSLRYDAD